MNKSEIIFNLAEILGCEARRNEPMSKHTSFKIGGNADVYIKVNNLSKLSTILKECQDSDVDYMLLGNGSNLLVSDDGIRGVVIRLDGDFRKITLVDDTTIFCGAGATFMNAGAYDGEMKDVVHSVSHISPIGEIGRIEKDNLIFGYRTSVYRSNNMIITGVTLKLKKGNPDEIRAKMDDYMSRRSTKQPLEYPSAGSVFKRPEGNFAGALIEQCGLKGKTCGGAQVSEKHAGFIINKSNATAKDVRDLISEIQKTVSDKTGYNLECELIIL